MTRRRKIRDAVATLEAAGIDVVSPHTWPLERLEAIIRAATSPTPFPEGVPR